MKTRGVKERLLGQEQAGRTFRDEPRADLTPHSGVDELRWDKPVRPGDHLSIRVTVLETRRSQSKPDHGIVRSFVEVMNQNREVVMSLKMVNIVRSRHSMEKK